MKTATTADAGKAFTWRDIPVRDLRSVRARLLKKYHTLSLAATAMKIPFLRLSNTIGGRENVAWIVAAIQQDLELSNHQVLMLWPMLREWPKTDRRAA